MHNQTVNTRIPTGWSLTTLGELLIDIEAGKSLKCEERPATCDEWGVLKVSAVSWGIFKPDENKVVPSTFLPPPEYEVRSGDLLMSRANTTALVGASVLVQDTRSHLMLSDKTLRLVVDDAIVVKPFLQIALRTRQARAYIEEHATGTSDSMKNISQETIRRIPIALPSLPEQRAIVRQLERNMAEIERLRVAAERQREAVAALPGAYLRDILESEEARGWEHVLLGDILRLRKEVIHPHNNPSGSATFVGLEHIESHTGRRIGSVNVEMSQLTGRKPQFFRGDIVYGYLRPYLNKVWVADFDGLCSVDQYVYSVDPERADTQYVAAFMRSPLYLERAPISTTPGQLPRIRIEEVAAVTIALPPLEYQQTLVTRLDVETRQITQLQQQFERQRMAIEALPEELLREVFG